MDKRTQKAQKVTIIGFIANAFLTAAKFAAGILGNSAAMVADAVHSLSDFISDLVVLIFLHFSGKECDENHPYGHGKFETLATLIISVLLFVIALGMVWSSWQQILHAFKGTFPETPKNIAAIVALVSILVKEILYKYTTKVAKEIKSPAVMANAWHHRSDALSSVGTLIGITGALILGGKWTLLDPIAAIFVSYYIFKVSIQLGLPSVNELLEKSLSKETEEEILNIICSSPEVKYTHQLRTRQIGNVYAIDIHIKLDPHLNVVDSHDIATSIENRLRAQYGCDTVINIHVEPYYPLNHYDTFCKAHR